MDTIEFWFTILLGASPPAPLQEKRGPRVEEITHAKEEEDDLDIQFAEVDAVHGGTTFDDDDDLMDELRERGAL